MIKRQTIFSTTLQKSLSHENTLYQHNSDYFNTPNHRQAVAADCIQWLLMIPASWHLHSLRMWAYDSLLTNENTARLLGYHYCDYITYDDNFYLAS